MNLLALFHTAFKPLTTKDFSFICLLKKSTEIYMYHYQYNKVLISLNKKKILNLDFNISLVYPLIKIQQRSKEKKEQIKSTAETCIKHNILFCL